MARKHKRLLGSRSYRNYSKGKLEEALGKVVDGTLSIREATRQLSIPFGTLYNRFKGIHGDNPGRPTIFTHDEELAILKSAAKCVNWGFPLSLLDMRMMAKYYIDRKGRTSISVKGNLEEFYDNLENTLRGLPSSNIFNYDESNFSDDPSKKRGIYRRGVKYPEKVINHLKSCTIIMSTGIHPADRDQVFEKLPPEQVADPTPIVENALTAFLKEQRFGDAVPSQRKRTRLQVQPGCSIATAAYGQESDDDEDGELGIEYRPASVSSICDVGEEEANSEDFEVGQFILGTFHSQRGKKTCKYVCKIL
ncbi:hypothetical protein JTB14_026625 [Gonioctena quinquepunctata]|nr:hypothetical protein JTB14_026625 [Gonioctena quinquepunctata]